MQSVILVHSTHSSALQNVGRIPFYAPRTGNFGSRPRLGAEMAQGSKHCWLVVHCVCHPLAQTEANYQRGSERVVSASLLRERAS